MAIDAGADTFEHGTPSQEEIDLAVEKGIAWTPTLYMTNEYLKWCESRLNHPDPIQARHARAEYTETMDYIERKHASVEYALKAGLKMVAGTDSFLASMRFDSLADELRVMVDYGFTPMQAIQAATCWAAQSMGWGDIGTLEAGKRADIIAVPGNPLSDIHVLNQVGLVVKAGVVIRRE
jgi:imidazolonepropionase-like amidohydrolase